MNMKHDIESPLSGTYKAVSSCLVYTKTEGYNLVVREFSRKSTRNKPLKSDFTAFKLFDFLENPRTMLILPDTQQVTTYEFAVCLLKRESQRSINHNPKIYNCNKLIVSQYNFIRLSKIYLLCQILKKN